MPLPTRNVDEPHDQFIERCMGDPVMVRDFPDSAQRRAVCERQAKVQSAGVLSLVSEPGAITIEAAADGTLEGQEKPQLPRFSMVAYTGGPMRIAGWRCPVIVDLAGLSVPSQSRPIRFGHDMASGVGHSDAIRVEDGNPIGIMPAITLVPTALSAMGTQLWRSLEIRDTTASTKYPIANPHQGKFRVEVSRYLSNTRYTGNSAKAWYLLAEPGDLPVIEVAFLNGQESPTIETAEADFSVLGVQMRGYHDFGVALQDPSATRLIRMEFEWERGQVTEVA